MLSTTRENALERETVSSNVAGKASQKASKERLK
jgi:hypothetical protein